jgi:argininosuccinate lyase
MYAAAQRGFINATDLADYLTKKGMPFRTAYKTVGTIVSECIRAGRVLEDMPLSDYKKHSELFSDDLFEEISLKTCVAKRISEGSTGYDSVEIQIKNMTQFLNERKEKFQ